MLYVWPVYSRFLWLSRSLMLVGLTGGIASGKSLCSDFFANCGYSIIDADIIARKVVEINQPALQQLTHHFGDIILNPDKSLNRKALKKIIFDDNQARTTVNNILHPAIRNQMQQQYQSLPTDQIAFLVVPLLFENQLDQQCDCVINVDINEGLQIIRGSKRDQSNPQQLQKIIDVQMSRLQRIAKSHFIINNNHSQQETFAQCAQIASALQALIAKTEQ